MCLFHEHHVCSIEDVPLFLQFNPYVQKGYRKANLSFTECCKSLLYLHNESTYFFNPPFLFVTYHQTVLPQTSASSSNPFHLCINTEIDD